MKLPTLVIVGRHDVICGPRWTEELHALIPGSRLLLLENSGHLGHIEEPGLFRDGVWDFVVTSASQPLSTFKPLENRELT